MINIVNVLTLLREWINEIKENDNLPNDDQLYFFRKYQQFQKFRSGHCVNGQRSKLQYFGVLSKAFN